MQSAHVANGKPVLAISLELSKASWRLALGDERHERPTTAIAKSAESGQRLQEVLARIAEVKVKWQLPADCRVVVLYEAGQDGFWIERALRVAGVEVLVVDAASIPVPRHAKRAKTDRLDALLLLETLWDWLRGKRQGIRIVHVPAAEAEDQRQLPRNRGVLQKEIGQHLDRISKLLRTVGCWDDLAGDFAKRLTDNTLRTYDHKPLPAQLRQRLLLECERLHFAQAQFRELERALMAQLPEPLQQKIAQLAQLKGVGWVGAMRLVLELYWRNFHNRRQVAACVGLVSQPYNSGNSEVDQGISKQGNRRVRSLLIELSWFWLKYQPDSAIAKWFTQRTSGNPTGKRGKRIAIVAVARRLSIALWRYLTEGTLPEGAKVKTARTPTKAVQLQAA
jgi:transposase